MTEQIQVAIERAKQRFFANTPPRQKRMWCNTTAEQVVLILEELGLIPKEERLGK